jgi:LPXTG-motif cell wall-anchored protein
MKRKNLPFGMISLSVALTVAAAALLTYQLLTSYDSVLLLFSSGVSSYPVLGLLTLALLASLSIFALFQKGELEPFSQKEPLFSRIASLIVLVGLLSTTVLLLFTQTLGDHFVTLSQQVNDNNQSTHLAAILVRYTAVLAPIAAIQPAILLLTGRVSPYSTMILTTWLLALALAVYFDITTVMNDPARLWLLTGLCMAVFFLLSKTAEAVGKNRPRFLLWVKLVSFSLLFTASLPFLILTAVGKLTFGTQTAYFTLLFGLSLLSISSVYHVKRRKKPCLPDSLLSDQPQTNQEEPTQQETPSSPLQKLIFTLENAPDTDLLRSEDEDEEDEEEEDSENDLQEDDDFDKTENNGEIS